MTGVATPVTRRSRLSGAARSATRRVDSGPVLVIAAGAGMASLSMSFWMPFLPLYMLELGATSNANALFWVGVAVTGQGVTRLVAGPIWGVLSDRFGRKLMYLRALYFATATTLIAAMATEPWHIAIAFACQGLFSGFIPAAVALTSVTVPESEVGKSLGTVTAAQYLGTTIGPAAGALLAIAFGMRGAIVASAVLPAIAATMVLLVVPRDVIERSAPRRTRRADRGAPTTAETRLRVFTKQLGIAVLAYFVLFATSQLLRLTAPGALSDFTEDDVTGLVGVAFTVAGVASVVGVIAARRLGRPGRYVRMIAGGMAATALVHVLIAASPDATLYVTCFAAISLLQAALLPASNTLIAASAPRERRGTAFGIASGAQALAFIVGSMGASLFAAVSLTLGYLVMAGLFVCVGLLTLLTLREPPTHSSAAA